MDSWIPGQSGNPKRGPRPKRLTKVRTVQNLARAIGRECVEFKDEDSKLELLYDAAGPVRYTRLERLLRVLWAMALQGDLPAIRCLFEYMEGKPVSQPPESGEGEGRPLAQKEIERLLAAAMVGVDEWRAGRKETSEVSALSDPQATSEVDIGKNG